MLGREVPFRTGEFDVLKLRREEGRSEGSEEGEEARKEGNKEKMNGRK